VEGRSQNQAKNCFGEPDSVLRVFPSSIGSPSSLMACLLQSLVKQLRNTMICCWRALGCVHPTRPKREQMHLAF